MKQAQILKKQLQLLNEIELLFNKNVKNKSNKQE